MDKGVFDTRFLQLLGCLAIAAALLAPSAIYAEESSAYDVQFEMPDMEQASELVSLLEATSRLVALKSEPPPSDVGLRLRAEADRERLATALHSRGYWDASIEFELQKTDGPTLVKVITEPGAPYRFDQIKVAALNDETREVLDEISLPNRAGLEQGAVATAQDVLSAEARLLDTLRAAGYPYASAPDRDVVIDRDEKTMSVEYRLASGPLLLLGAPRFQGLEGLNENAALKRVAWEAGDSYDPKLIEETRRDLGTLDVFESIRVRLPERESAGQSKGPVPVVIEVKEKKRRFIGAGANYSTGEGFGGDFFWGHRNLFGHAERFEIEASFGRVLENSATEIDYGLSASLRKPDFWARRQTLTLDSAVIVERPDAFERMAITAGAGLERPLSNFLIGTAGVTLELSEVEDIDGTEEFALVGLPVSLRYDTSDDLLDPAEGLRATARLTPYFAAIGEAAAFAIGEVSASTYFDIFGDRQVVIAARASIGSVLGADSDDVPADKRFYAGGGGSIRGYEFQAVGPRNARNQPRGGASLLEVGFEARIKIMEDIAVVPFIDGGNAYDESYPDPTQRFQWGAGIGLRYHTDFGPLRLDIGTPINPRRGDDAFQIYISLGQAF